MFSASTWASPLRADFGSLAVPGVSSPETVAVPAAAAGVAISRVATIATAVAGRSVIGRRYTR